MVLVFSDKRLESSNKLLARTLYVHLMKVTGAMSKTTELSLSLSLSCSVIRCCWRRKGRLKSFRFATESGEHIIELADLPCVWMHCMHACPQTKRLILSLCDFPGKISGPSAHLSNFSEARACMMYTKPQRLDTVVVVG